MHRAPKRLSWFLENARKKMFGRKVARVRNKILREHVIEYPTPFKLES